MNTLDIVLLTSINVVGCVAFPKLLSIVLAVKKSQSETLKKAQYNVTSFPYCTSYSLTDSPLCRFRPNFCSQCSA